jgi:arogenate dehydrogenase (NADP+)
MNIGIVGLGLIGGSMGLDFRACGHEVWGVSQRSSTCETALEIAAVDHASTDFATLALTDVIFICTPIGLIEPTVRRLIPHLRSETILTDVGSVKASLVSAIAPLWPNFVGGHPMSGTAESGIRAAIPHLFVGNPYVLTPIDRTPTAAMTIVANLVADLQGQLLYCQPEAHDRAVAWISHLPVMVSASLIAACLNEADTEVLTLAKALASSGWRDTSRVGGGNPELGQMMAEYNQTALLKTLYAYRQQLDAMINTVEGERWESLKTTLIKTQAERPQFLRD